MTNSGFIIEISSSWPYCIDLRAVCSVLQPVLGGEASMRCLRCPPSLNYPLPPCDPSAKIR
jgi:hypothetical protein